MATAIPTLPLASVAPPAPGNRSGQPARPVIYTHVIFRTGYKILFSQRGGPYCRWHMPSGKLEQGDPLSVAAARPLYEKVGIIISPGLSCGTTTEGVSP
ncbi:NUDIX domain-containing protein [Streptomyces sp. NPDC057623]|uniref:NUDIX domain-containing protein n=1 Tax=Streptomyces sp. NPDC057623 TaxID=3346187 RepID=UPI0036C0C23B